MLYSLKQGFETKKYFHTHRSGRGLPGYLILFAPHAFVY